MKHSLFDFFFFSLKILLPFVICLFLVNPVQAIQNIEWVEADQQYVFIDIPTQITITAKIAEDPDLIPESVYLYKYNELNRPIANMGRLYDDGTHGDLIANNNTFTTQITFNETDPGELRFKITVAYKGTLRRLQSDMVIIQAKIKADPEVVKAEFIDILRTGSSEDIMNYLAPGEVVEEVIPILTTEKRDQLANWVQAAELTQEVGNTRYYQYLLPAGGTIKFRMLLNQEGIWVFIF